MEEILLIPISPQRAGNEVIIKALITESHLKTKHSDADIKLDEYDLVRHDRKLKMRSEVTDIRSE